MPAPQVFQMVGLPLINETSINVELSQLRLYLPTDHQWHFEGSMKHLENEREFAVGFQSYLGRRIQEAQRALEGMNDYSIVRAADNLKEVRRLYEDNVSETSTLDGRESHELRMAQAGNDALLREAELQVQEQLQRGDESYSLNRSRLNAIFEGNQAQRSSNVVSDLGQNFDAGSSGAPAASGNYFNSNWYQSNGLITQDQAPVDLTSRGAPQSESRVYRGRGNAQAEEDLDALRSQNSRTQALFEQNAPARQPSQQGQGQAPATAPSNLDRYQSQLQNSLGTPSVVDSSASMRQSGGLGGGAAGPAIPGGGPGGGLAPGEPSSGYAVGSGGVPGMDPRGTSAADGEFGDVTILGGQLMATDYEDMGLASLELELPTRGELYMFSTPRGEVEVSARGVSNGWLERMIGLAIVVVGLFIVLLIGSRIARAGQWSWPFGPTGSVTMVLAGLALCIGVGLSWPALALIAFGLIRGGWLAWRRMNRQPLPAEPSAS